MKLKFNKNLHGEFYIILEFEGDDCKTDDCKIAKLLDISFKEYTRILIQHNAFHDNNYDMYYYFKNQKDIESAMEELEPYLIMATLIN